MCNRSQGVTVAGDFVRESAPTRMRLGASLAWFRRCLATSRAERPSNLYRFANVRLDVATMLLVRQWRRSVKGRGRWMLARQAGQHRRAMNRMRTFILAAAIGRQSVILSEQSRSLESIPGAIAAPANGTAASDGAAAAAGFRRGMDGGCNGAFGPVWESASSHQWHR